MENSLRTFHTLVDSIWNQECEEEDFTNVLQQTAQLKSLLWSADLMQADEELRIQFFDDMLRMEYVAKQVLQPEAIKPLDLETRTYYGYLYAFLCQYSNDLLLIYYGFPFQYPIHISCGNCDNDIHSVLVNPAELNEKNTTTVVPTEYLWENDGLSDRHNLSEEWYIESETIEDFGEKDWNEWNFFGNVMRMLDACEEEYLTGILRYLYGNHICTKCHHSEPVIESYRRWFYANQPNYDEPKRELIDWVIEQAKKAKREHNKERASFFHKMAVWYEMSRNTPDWEKGYDEILSYYETDFELVHDNAREIQFVLRELVNTNYESLKVRAYNLFAAACGFDYDNEEKNRWDLTWQAHLKAVGISQKLHNLEDKGYWNALNGLCIAVVESKEGNIDLVDELIQDYIVKMEAISNKEAVGEAYNRLAYMWAEAAGDYEKCYSYFHKYLQITTDIYGEENELVAYLHEELANYYEEDGNEEKACEYRERALEINIRIMGQVYLLPPVFKELALMVANATNAIDKEEEFQKVILTANSYQSLAESYYELKKYEKAMDCCKKAEALYEWAYKDKVPHSKMAKVYKRKGDIFSEQGNHKAARKEYLEAIDICNYLLELSTYGEEMEECQELLNDMKEYME